MEVKCAKGGQLSPSGKVQKDPEGLWMKSIKYCGNQLENRRIQKANPIKKTKNIQIMNPFVEPSPPPPKRMPDSHPGWTIQNWSIQRA